MAPQLWRTTHSYITTDSTEDLTQGSATPQRRGIWHFLVHSPMVATAFFAGLAVVTLVTWFVSWLSGQILICPQWAVDCEVTPRVEWITNNLGTVQGLSTACYAVGLAALAYAAHAFSESAMWPILSRQSFTLDQMDTYLQTSRGSVPSSLLAFWTARNLDLCMVLLATVIITLLPLAGAPLMGRVFDQANHSVQFNSQYHPGGGTGPRFTQINPPGPIKEKPTTLYQSWAQGLSDEPMPAYRDWYIDRSLLVDRGNFTAKAVRVQQNITCTGWAAMPTKKKDNRWHFDTDMENHNEDRKKRYKHQKTIKVRDKAALAVWAHDYLFESERKTSTKLIFAAVNGSIDGGRTVENAELPEESTSTQISSIACDIVVGFVDDILKVGSVDDINPAQLGSVSIEQLHNPGGPPGWNELALWLTVAPITVGVSVYGAMPMYHKVKESLPRPYTSTGTFANDYWTTRDIEDFIRVSTGAVSSGESLNFPDHTTVTFKSWANTIKLDPSRPVLLVSLPVLILLNMLILVLWNAQMHRRAHIPTFQAGTLNEIVKCAQSEEIRNIADAAWRDKKEEKRLKSMKLSYSKRDGVLWGLHSDGNEKVAKSPSHFFRRKPLPRNREVLLGLELEER
ncbi:hypothetical protein NX059_006886 [Plenodomus lindquistii]|nr:hypothetical protein NX059_006886 [Plenodomus lindquistii]